MVRPLAARGNLSSQLFARLAGVVVAVVGLLALLGQGLDLTAVRGALSALIPLRTNTALAFLLGGLALLALVPPTTARRRLLGQLCAAAVALIGVLTVVEYLAGWNLGVDQFLLLNPTAPGTLSAGRMASVTALCYLLVGAALLLLSLGRGLRLAQSCALVVGAISLLNFMGYAYNVRLADSFLFFTQVALHTAGGLFLLALGVLGAYPDRGIMRLLTSDNVGGVLIRRVLPAAIIVPFLLSWLWLLGQQAGLFDLSLGMVLFAMANAIIFTALIWGNGIVFSRRDAERKRMEAALRSREERFRVLFAGNPLPLWVYDLETLAFLDVNDAAVTQYGYTRPAFLAMRIPDLLLEDETLDLPGDGANAPAQSRHRKKDGQIIDVQITAHTIESDDHTAALMVAEDITARKRADAEHVAREAAEAANLAKSEFLSRMSHELRTPLNSILGFGQLLTLGELTPQQAESVDYILKGGRHLLELINEVLDIARIESGRLSVSLEPVAVGEVLEECLNLVGPAAAAQQVLLHLEPAPAGLHVQADRQRLKQVILNLLSNGIKYNQPGGSVRVSCAPGPNPSTARNGAHPQPAAPATLRILVADTGFGIPEEALPHLFVAFQRLGAEQRGIEGTGLGLVLCQRLTELMGGTIGVASTPGAGSTFWVELPVSAPHAPDLEPAPASLSAPLAPADHDYTVLYVEDNFSNLRLMEHIFAQRPNVKLVPTMQGQMALDLARQQHPDLILLDLHLPDMAGDEVLRRLQRDPQTAAIPVVMVSADATTHQIDRLLALGARAYLTKPLDVHELLAVLKDNLARRR